MDALGRDFNFIPIAEAVKVNMRDCREVTFFGHLSGGDVYTLKEHTTTADAGQNLAVITDWFINTSGVGAAVWTKSAAQVAAATVPDGNELVIGFSVAATSLSDGYKYLSLTSTGAGLVYAITTGLVHQRDPRNLPALAV
jgi:hypothetical protein